MVRWNSQTSQLLGLLILQKLNLKPFFEMTKPDEELEFMTNLDDTNDMEMAPVYNGDYNNDGKVNSLAFGNIFNCLLNQSKVYTFFSELMHFFFDYIYDSILLQFSSICYSNFLRYYCIYLDHMLQRILFLLLFYA